MMKENDLKKTEKDEQKRKQILSGNMWVVVLTICIPLALYQSVNQIFGILDTKMAVHISSYAASAVAYVSQIIQMIAAVGTGLAMGSSLKISEAYGAGDYRLLKKRVSNMYAMCGLLALLSLILLPFSADLLRFMKIPQELLDIGTRYFAIALIGTAVAFINNAFIAIERARGNAKFILYYNIFSVVLKLTITYFMIYRLNYGIASIAAATLITQMVLLGIAVYCNLRHNKLFCFSVRQLSLERNVSPPMVRLSIPVVFEKIAFAFGKVIVNSMSSGYGVLTVGALGITNTISGLTTAPQNGFQEGGAAIISQNIGAGNLSRAIEAFKVILSYNLLIGAAGFAGTMYYVHEIAGIFAPEDAILRDMVVHIYSYEAFGAIALGIGVSVMALLYGCGKTKLTFLMNFARLFIFRVPVLWLLQRFTSMGYEAVGVVMMVSNVSVAVMGIVIGGIVIRQLIKGMGVRS